MGTIKGNFEIQDPQSIEMRLSVIMTVKNWNKIKQEIDSHYDINDSEKYYHPINVMNREISKIIEKANKEFAFYETTDNPNERSD